MKECPICGGKSENRTISSEGKNFFGGCENCNNYIICLTKPQISAEAKSMSHKWALKTLESGVLSVEDAEIFRLWADNAQKQIEGKMRGTVSIGKKKGDKAEVSLEYTNKAEKIFSSLAVLTVVVFVAIGLLAGIIGVIIGLVIGAILGNLIYNVGMLFIEMSNNIAKNNVKIKELEDTLKRIETAVITEKEG